MSGYAHSVIKGDIMARRGPKPKIVNDALRKNVFKRPEFLDSMPSKGQRGREIALISSKLKAMSGDEAIVHDIVEFCERFKCEIEVLPKIIQYIKTQLKNNYGIKTPRVHHDIHNGKIYIWAVGLKGQK